MTVAAVWSSTAADDKFAAGIEVLTGDSLLSNAHLGLAIYDITAESMLYELNSNRLFSPASNLKLFTSAAALELLGPGYRFKTGFYKTGRIDNKGRLKGDLIIRGGGDPLISGRFRESVTEVLELWADSLLLLGIKEIKGNIMVDNSFFSGPDLGAGWSWDDLSYWYACPLSALSFNDNCVDLEFFPGLKVGDPAIIKINPVTDYIKITNQAVTSLADSDFTLDYYRVPYTNDVEFFGSMAVNDTDGVTDYVSVDRPELYTVSVFIDILKTKGIKFKGEYYSLDDRGGGELNISSAKMENELFEWKSDSLGSVISVINKNSQNFFAEQSLMTLGRELGGEGSLEKGIEIAAAFYDSIGISSDDLAMYDGSGLSYINLVKPSAITRLLRYMHEGPNSRVYYESLAIPGQDRSVRNRLMDEEYRENVHAKTGSISNTRSFSGYIDGPRTGHLIAFSIMINNYSCESSYVTDWYDSIAAAILREY